MLARGSAPFLLAPSVGVFLGLGVEAYGRPVGGTVAVVSMVILAAFVFFFRDPQRRPGRGVVSASDGRVQEAGEGRVRVFLSPFNVHVLRAPLDGRVTRATYRRGGHRPAFSKDSEDNERLDLELETGRGVVEVALIAGTVARRIRPYVTAGDKVSKGQRIGLIAFGSRCDVRMPSGTTLVVARGQRVRAATTTLAT